MEKDRSDAEAKKARRADAGTNVEVQRVSKREC